MTLFASIDAIAPSPEEVAALSAARDLIARHGAEGEHHVAAAALTEGGAVHLGLNLESVLPAACICAEPGALSRAEIDAPGAPVTFVVAVNRRGEVLPPCGVCRELLTDHASAARIGLPGPDGGMEVAPLAALLPRPYKARLRGGA